MIFAKMAVSSLDVYHFLMFGITSLIMSHDATVGLVRQFGQVERKLWGVMDEVALLTHQASSLASNKCYQSRINTGINGTVYQLPGIIC